MTTSNTFLERMQPVIDGMEEGADKEKLLALVESQDTVERIGVFFASWVSAPDARRLDTAIIRHTCSRTRQLKLESYGRLFPNQDTMPKGGFCNLISLPLQKLPRENGCSIFVDADLRPYPDQ